MKFVLPWLLLCSTTAWGGQQGDAASISPRPGAGDVSLVEIHQLIRELGASDFIRREQAQERLLEVGLSAFDALAAAQDDPDLEIAERARYLLHSLQVRWAEEEDAPEVKNAVRNYESASLSERRSLIDRLGGFPVEISAAALARIARFEREAQLSKRAALAVLSQKPPQDDSDRVALGERIATLAGGSDRPAAGWLRCYADQLRNPQDEELDRRWSELILEERRQLATLSDPATEETVRDLMRWRARSLSNADRKEDARQAMLDLMELVDDQPSNLLSAADWYLSVEAWDLVEQLKARFDGAFARSLMLQYRYAEALLRQGRQDEASQVAQAARGLRPQDDDEHLLAAQSLQDRGIPQWAEAELLDVMGRHQDIDVPHLRARWMLSELLHDGWRELEAAEALQHIVDRAEEDATVEVNLKTATRRGMESIKSRMYLFYANHYEEKGDREKQKEYLAKGMADEFFEIDLIIAQYRFENDDPQWNGAVMARIETAANDYRSRVAAYKQQLNAQTLPAQRSAVEAQVALYCNQLAWLIANTEGDFDEALKAGEEAVRLTPDYPGYMDTLARCHFALKQHRQAVDLQRRAVGLDPGSQSMRRQLTLFEKALAEEEATVPAPQP